jgi:hypothetical protein
MHFEDSHIYIFTSIVCSCDTIKHPILIGQTIIVLHVKHMTEVEEKPVKTRINGKTSETVIDAERTARENASRLRLIDASRRKEKMAQKGRCTLVNNRLKDLFNTIVEDCVLVGHVDSVRLKEEIEKQVDDAIAFLNLAEATNKGFVEWFNKLLNPTDAVIVAARIIRPGDLMESLRIATKPDDVGGSKDDFKKSLDGIRNILNHFLQYIRFDVPKAHY